MLEQCNPATIDTSFWDKFPSRAQLPCSREEYFSQRGATPLYPQSLRDFHRFHFRGIAILRCSDTYHVAYTKDLSRAGLAFYSPVQLFPREHVLLWLSPVKTLELSITRCKRLDEDCYECGSLFRIMSKRQKDQYFDFASQDSMAFPFDN